MLPAGATTAPEAPVTAALLPVERVFPGPVRVPGPFRTAQTARRSLLGHQSAEALGIRLRFVPALRPSADPVSLTGQNASTRRPTSGKPAIELLGVAS